MNQFRAEDGLQTDLIKCVAQDSLGFIWIGSDDGLIKYDATTFISYPNSTSSGYIKDFLKTSENRLFVIHDMGMTEIRSSIDTAYFETIIDGSINVTDSTLWYPKSAFEDSSGNIWVAEPQSVVRFNPSTNNIKRFQFGSDDNSTSFVRSFSFLQLSSEELLISSFTGNFFIYNTTNEEIVKIERSWPELSIYAIQNIHDQYLLGTSLGIYQLTVRQEEVSLVPLQEGFIVTDLIEIDNDEFLATSENMECHLITKMNEGIVDQVLPNTNLTVNQVFKSKDNTIWLSTLKGLYLFSEPQFKTLDKITPTYVEGIFTHPDNPFIYIISKELIITYDKRNERIENVYNIPSAYFLSACADADGVWVGNSFQVWYYNNEEISTKIDLTDYGRFIFTLYMDNEGVIWVTQETARGVKKIDPNTSEVIVLQENQGLDQDITAIRSDNGDMYAAASDHSAYLYLKEQGDETFKNISHEIPEEYRNGFKIEDIVILNDTVWLATNYGLFQHNDNDVRKVSFNSEFDNSNMRVLIKDNDYLWFGNQFGLFRYDPRSGDYSIFNEVTGLPANSVNEESLLISDNKIWVGTPFGVAYKEYTGQEYDKTIQPYILEVKTNGKKTSWTGGIFEVPYMAYLEFTFASLSFPANEIQYSYRIPQIDKGWSKLSLSNIATYPELEDGSYTFEVRSKKIGEYNFSDIESISFQVAPSFYSTYKFYLIVVSVLLLFVVLTRYLTRFFMQKRQEVLEKMVADRTAELNQYKDNLEELVKERTHELEETQSQLIQAEKMASLGTLTAGVAHEINNPINYIQAGLYGIKMLFKPNRKIEVDDEFEETLEEITSNMQLGVDRVSKIVASLGRFSRTSSDKKENCNLHEIINNCLQILSHEIKNKAKVERNYCDDAIIINGSESDLHQLFNNLISNAIQAIQRQGEIIIETKNGKSNVEISITDDGQGIAEENLAKLYDPFFTTKAPGQGTGLGLYIAQKVVKEHNGTINFQSIIGKGTTVKVIFSKLKHE